jgi:hypothetical protein
MMTSAERTMRASLAAYHKHAVHDPVVAAVRGQAGLLDRFRRQVLDRDPDLPEAEVERRAECLRRAHMTTLAFKAVRARRLKAAGKPAGKCGCGVELTSTTSRQRGQCFRCARRDA